MLLQAVVVEPRIPRLQPWGVVNHEYFFTVPDGYKLFCDFPDILKKSKNKFKKLNETHEISELKEKLRKLEEGNEGNGGRK